MKIPLLVVITGIFSLSTVFGSEASDRLDRARLAVAQGKDRAARPDLEWLVSQSRRTAEGEEGAVLLIETALRSGDWALAEKQIDRFLKYHINSPYRSRVEWGSARMLLRNGEFLSSAHQMAILLSRPLTSPLRSEVRDQLRRVLDSEVLGPQELEVLLKHGVTDPELTGEILYRLAVAFEREERWRGALHFHRWLIREFPNHPRSSLSREKIVSLSRKGAGRPIVVFLAPLTGDFAPFGNDLLQGGLLALEQGGAEAIAGWRAVDSRAQPAEALAALRQIFAQENVMAVVGPVLSPVAAAVAGWMAYAVPSVPLIVPVAGAEGISDLGPNIFQLSPPTSEQARVVARYAMECLGHREFAVLAPRTVYGDDLASAFVTEAEELGGTILGVESYVEGQPDYKSHFETLRVKGYKQLRERRLIAAGVDDLTDRSGAKARGSFLADSLIEVDAVFIAASTPEDAIQLAGQTAFYKVQGQFLGASGWYGTPLLRGGRKVVDGAVFATDFLEKSDDPVRRKFYESYQKRWGIVPGQDHVAGLSYDGVRFLLRALKTSRERPLLESLRSIGKIPGVYGEIRLDPATGGNRNISLVSVSGGSFQVIDDCPDGGE